MDYSYRNLEEGDYELLSEWNAEYGIGTMDNRDYPSGGFVVLNDYGETIMCHMYITGTDVAFVSFYRNPFEKRQGRSFEHAIDFSARRARGKGIKKLITSSHSFNRKTLIQLGYKELNKTGYLVKKL